MTPRLPVPAPRWRREAALESPGVPAMSLILDALNRSRQEGEQVPGLSSIHPVEDSTIDMSWLPWVLVCALALSVLVIAWLLFDRAPPPAAAPATATAEASLPAVAAPAAPAPLPAPALPAAEAITVAAASPAEPAPAPAATAEAAAEMAQAVDTAPLAAPLPDLDPAPELREPAPVDASVAELYRRQAEAPAEEPPARPALRQRDMGEQPASVVAEEPVDIDRLVQAAREELADAQLSDSDVPFLSAQSQQTKDGIPTLMYLRHDYSGDPASSSVVLNGKTLRQGGSVGGVRVEEILPDSVVLEYQGVRFRLRALNSWVNL